MMDAASGSQTILSLQSVSMRYGNGPDAVQAVGGVTLDVRAGEFLTIVGPSGCGKSTVLQIAAGLLRGTGGQALMRGQPVVEPPEGLVYLFQQYSRSLFPWMKVRDNVLFGFAQRAGADRRQAREACEEYLSLVGLEGLGERYPWQLSGGMQQRVAIARALAAAPQVLLLDEPFSAVDALTRAALHDLVLDVQHKRGLTVVLVTHDVDEAVYLSSRIVLLGPRPSTVAHVYDNPLPRPRDPVQTRAQPEFSALRGELLARLLGRAT
jgi:NitT/TauT family transport system ATP-binding protein